MSLVRFIVVTCILAVVQNVSCDKQLFIQKSTNQDDDVLLSVNWDEKDNEINAVCTIISGKDQVEKALKSANKAPVEISEDEMQEYLQECEVVNEIQHGAVKKVQEAPQKKTTNSTSETTTAGYDGIPVIFPGTKWCGAGDRAKNYDDLGLHQDTDRCCRAHDLCNDTLAPGESRNGLKNSSPFTKLSCQCDEDFYNCLDKVNSMTSNTIGNMYFNVLKRECYKMDYPDSKKCKKYRTFLKIKCIEYEKNTKAEKEYRWVKAKTYKKIPFPGPLTVTLPSIFTF